MENSIMSCSLTTNGVVVRKVNIFNYFFDILQFSALTFSEIIALSYSAHKVMGDWHLIVY